MKKTDSGFSLIITLIGVLVVTVFLGSAFIGVSTSERIASNADTFSHAANLSDYAATIVMHDQSTVNAAVSKAIEMGQTKTPETLPLSMPSGFSANGNASIWVQKLPPPINSSPGVINSYVINVDVDLEAKEVTRKKTKGFLRFGTAYTGHN